MDISIVIWTFPSLYQFLFLFEKQWCKVHSSLCLHLHGGYWRTTVVKCRVFFFLSSNTHSEIQCKQKFMKLKKVPTVAHTCIVHNWIKYIISWPAYVCHWVALRLEKWCGCGNVYPSYSRCGGDMEITQNNLAFVMSLPISEQWCQNVLIIT